jgi:hypothetical protein
MVLMPDDTAAESSDDDCPDSENAGEPVPTVEPDDEAVSYPPGDAGVGVYKPELSSEET